MLLLVVNWEGDVINNNKPKRDLPDQLDLEYDQGKIKKMKHKDEKLKELLTRPNIFQRKANTKNIKK